MSLPSNLVTIHPYFKIHPGKEQQVAAAQQKFIARTRAESKCLFYEFTADGDIVFCREGYAGAEGAMEHIEGVADVLGEMLEAADLLRLEIHGTPEDIDVLSAKLAGQDIQWFRRSCGL